MDLSELQDIDSLGIEGTNMVYRGVGARTSAIKFALAGTQERWHRFTRLLVC